MGEMTLARGKEATEPRPHTGRPTLYTHALGQAICDKIAQGMTKRGACGLLGVTEETYQLWSTTRPEFITLLSVAEGKAEEVFTKALLEAAEDRDAKGDWRPAIEWLKRRRRADYGDTLDIRKVDAETLMQLLRLQQAENQTEPLALEAGDEAL